MWISLSVHLASCLSIFMSVSICDNHQSIILILQNLYFNVHLFVCPSVYLSRCPSLMSTFHLSVNSPIYLVILVSIHLYVYIFDCQSVCLLVYYLLLICLSISMSVFIFNARFVLFFCSVTTWPRHQEVEHWSSTTPSSVILNLKEELEVIKTLKILTVFWRSWDLR